MIAGQGLRNPEYLTETMGFQPDEAPRKVRMNIQIDHLIEIGVQPSEIIKMLQDELVNNVSIQDEWPMYSAMNKIYKREMEKVKNAI